MFASATASATSILKNSVRLQLPKLRSAIALTSSRTLSVSNDDDEQIPANYTDIPNKEPYFPPPREPYMSMWGERPPCCPEECEILRHDVLYLKDKPKKYTRTWVEQLPLKRKKVICNEKLEPEYELRPRRITTQLGSKAPCVGEQTKLDLMQCINPPKLNEPCSRIRMPGCALPRIPPKCVETVASKCCQKRCTLYPSYSECDMKKPKVKPPVECLCSKIPSNCEIFMMFRKFPVK